MRKNKLIMIVASVLFVFSIGAIVLGQILDAINESHNITLARDIVKVSKDNSNFDTYVEYNNDSTIYVDTDEAYDLVAVTNDNSEGFVINTNISTKSYSLDQSKFNTNKTYYILAFLYHSYNRYINDFYDLELLNNEYRHNVVNDDLNIGNVTDFYNLGHEYIGDFESYDLSNGLYDYKGNVIKSITNGENSITYPLSGTVNLKNYHRNDFYKYESNNLVLVNSNTNIELELVTDGETKFSGYYDSYGRKLDHIYYVDSNGKEWNYVFTEDGIVTNGILNNPTASSTISLNTSYYDNGIVVDSAYNSKTFKNIYVLNDFETTNAVTLMMPCNIHFINNHIILNDDITLKHYYHSSYKIDNLTISGTSGGFSTNSNKKFTYICPNASIDALDDSCIVSGTSNLLNDALDFASGYFVDYILKDKYYQVYDETAVAKKLVSYDSVNLVDGLYTSADGGATKTPVESITDVNGITYTLTFNSSNLITGISNGTDTYTIEYENNSIKRILKGSLELEDRNIYIDISDQAEYYTLFLTNPVLPKNFYDEDVSIKYTYTGTNNPFYVTANEDNQQVNITLTAVNNKTGDTSTKNVSVWIMGTNNQAIADTIALKLECDINRGFSRNSTSRMYINYDTISEIVGNNNISIEAINNLIVKDEYLVVNKPASGNNSINSYIVTYTYTVKEVSTQIMFQSGEYYVSNDGQYVKAISYNPSQTYYVRSAIPTPVEDKSTYSDSNIYAEKYMLIERVSYSIKDGFAEMKITLTDNNQTYEKIIYAQLPRISKEKYIEYIKNEIGQIFFGSGNDNKYQLPGYDILAHYDVKNVSYVPVVFIDGAYQVTQAFSIDDAFVMTNVNSSNAQSYYLKVTLTLKDNEDIEFLTDKIALTTSTTGGDGENEYQSSLFEEDFNKISTFIGLSDDFVLNGNVYYYLEITNDDAVNATIQDSNNHVYLGLYRKISSYDSANIPANGTYFYINPNSTKLEKIYIDGTHSIPQNKPALYTAPSDSDEVVGTNYKMVFLTDSDYIPQTSTTIKVKSYITDSTTIHTAAELKAQAALASEIDLYQGLYDFNGNPIYEITNGNITYILEYTFNETGADVSNVYKRNESGEIEPVSNGTNVDISGFYCMGYVFKQITEGDRIYLDNGYYSSQIIYGNFISTYNYDKVTFTISNNPYRKDLDSDYQKYGPASISKIELDLSENETYYDKNGVLIKSDNFVLMNGDTYNGIYESNGAPVTNFVFSESGFQLTYDENDLLIGVKVKYTMANSEAEGKYYRIPSQQTTFYDKSHHVITIYAQSYSFVVPGIYNPSDFNWNGNEAINETGAILASDTANSAITYDLYEKLMELFGFDNGDGHFGFKEINGKNYFLLTEYLDDAKDFGAINYEYEIASSYSNVETYYELVDNKYVVADSVDENNYSSYYVVSNISYLPIDCGGKYVNIKNLEKCINLEGIYIKNAKFGEESSKAYNISDYEAGEITSQTEIASGLVVYAKDHEEAGDNKNFVEIDTCNETVNGVIYTKRLKFGGGASFSNGTRFLELDITGNTKTLIQVVLKSQNSNENRDLGIADSINTSNNTCNEVGRLTSSKGSGNANIETFLYEGNSNKLYLYPRLGHPSSIYAIYVYNISNENDNLRNSNLKNTIKNLYLDNIIGISGVSFDFSDYKEIENLTITNSKLVTMPTLYRRIKNLNLSNNYLSDISNIESGVGLTNVDLRNNLIKTFESLRGFKTFKSLYVGGNNSNALAVVNDNDMFIYGAPREFILKQGNDFITTYRGLINITNLVQVCDNNPLLDETNTDFYELIYDVINNGDINYLYTIYTLNAISYSYTHSNGLKIDLALLEKNGYSTAVYVSSDTANYVALTKGNSSQYSYTGYYSTNDTNYKYVLISVTKNGYTSFREIYIKTN